ncbi:efflux RND transporter permease subunit [Prolixibacter denitrificans]|uniref:Acriflavine resistance protein B n=1 Tax=Prolixibacter denitrificans TaxID=1541063 RepID=A0A2P8CE56_9BACT|nr:efflux RND transporter permease subunit [Prolixibacter denitrificans]PSK83202.1 HAE1 family hydrophobic/amphiphilic exporter-1 [Prolixibacter denitrificans]GET21915.1 acriflavine resistance protein B [Prolixibacter denitrificans]
MRKLTNFSVNYPVTVLMAVLAILLLGIISYQRLGIDLFPDLNSPRLYVEIKSGERPPEEMETLFVKNIEALAIRQSKVTQVSSIIRTGSAQVTVEYAWGKDMDEAFLDLQKALSNYSQNSEIDELNITQHDPNTAPVMIVGLSNESISDMNDLRKVAENYIRNELIRLEGIAEVELAGQEEREVRIDTDPYKLEAFNLTMDELSQKIEAFNRSISGGSITETGMQYIVKGVSMLRDIDDFNNLVVGYKAPVAGDETAQKTPIFLREVAHVSYQNKEPENIVRVNGKRCIGLAIYKETRFNTVKAVQDINEELAKITKALPGYHFTVVSNQGTFIKSAINEVKNTLLIGIVLAVFVLFLFLRRFGTTLIVSLAIPISIIATFNLMYFNGLTLNIMTLGGLALGAGMLVDNAIVVMENIFRNHESGLSVRESAIVGTAQVGGAITASTLTTIVVFLPIVYLHGASGELFRDQAWTVAFSLLSSLVVAIFLIPMMYHRIYRKKEATLKFRSVQVKGYGTFLSRILERRWWVIGGGIALLVISALLYPFIGSEFMPKADSREFTIEVKMPEGTPLERTSDGVASMEALLKELLGDNVQSIYSRIGPGSDLSETTQSVFEGENTAEVKVVLKPNAKYSSRNVVEAVSKWYKDNPQFEVNFVQDETALQSILGTQDAPVVVEVQGEDLNVIDTLTRQVMKRVQNIPGLYNMRTNIEDGYPEVDVEVDRLMAGMHNLSVEQVVSQITAQLEGQDAGQMEKGGEMRDITIHTPKMSLRQFHNIELNSNGQVIRLDEIARLKESVSPKEIYRLNQNRIGKVMADLDKNVPLDKVVSQMRSKLAGMQLPNDYKIKIAGEEQKREDSMHSLEFALLLSIILVYMVMASQFESLIHPFVILLTIPFSLVGTVLLFFIMGQPFNIMALIGVIMLVGIAVNDSIIFVDRINQLWRGGMEKREAIAVAGQQRIRPIIMTSLTTILALLPLTFGFGESASLRSSMALAVIGGLVTSTILTLVVIPCVYDLFTGKTIRSLDTVTDEEE